MNTLADTITIIEKELLETIHFPHEEVLSDAVLIQFRKYEAQRAMKLGNTYKDKVKIVFEDTEGLKMVETTVWGMTDNDLIFKRGMMMPLHRVHEIII
jgi:hypothetical protein